MGRPPPSEGAETLRRLAAKGILATVSKGVTRYHRQILFLARSQASGTRIGQVQRLVPLERQLRDVRTGEKFSAKEGLNRTTSWIAFRPWPPRARLRRASTSRCHQLPSGHGEILPWRRDCLRFPQSLRRRSSQASRMAWTTGVPASVGPSSGPSGVDRSTRQMLRTAGRRFQSRRTSVSANSRKRWTGRRNSCLLVFFSTLPWSASAKLHTRAPCSQTPSSARRRCRPPSSGAWEASSRFLSLTSHGFVRRFIKKGGFGIGDSVLHSSGLLGPHALKPLCSNPWDSDGTTIDEVWGCRWGP